MNEDFRDILSELLSARARFLVVGAHAVAVHGVPRATGDLDVWIDPDVENVPRVWTALVRFGAPVETLGVTIQDLAKPGTIVQIGFPPRRIDVMTSVTGIAFEDAWTGRVTHRVAVISKYRSSVGRHCSRTSAPPDGRRTSPTSMRSNIGPGAAIRSGAGWPARREAVPALG